MATTCSLRQVPVPGSAPGGNLPRHRQSGFSILPNGFARVQATETETRNALQQVGEQAVPLLGLLAAKVVDGGAFEQFSTADLASIGRDGVFYRHWYLLYFGYCFLAFSFGLIGLPAPFLDGLVDSHCKQQS